MLNMRYAKINQLYKIVALFVMRQKNIVRLHIAVNNAFGMRAVQGAHQLTHNQTRRHRTQRPYAFQTRRKRFARQKLHHHVRVAIVRHVKIKNRADIDMLKRCRRSRLAHKALLVFLVVRKITMHHLNGNRLVDHDVLCLKKLAHRATAKLALYLVLATKYFTGFVVHIVSYAIPLWISGLALPLYHT